MDFLDLFSDFRKQNRYCLTTEQNDDIVINYNNIYKFKANKKIFEFLCDIKCTNLKEEVLINTMYKYKDFNIEILKTFCNIFNDQNFFVKKDEIEDFLIFTKIFNFKRKILELINNYKNSSNNQDILNKLAFKPLKSLKITFALLYNTFGINYAIMLSKDYNKTTKRYTYINPILSREIQDQIKNKNRGFCNFIDYVAKNRNGLFINIKSAKKSKYEKYKSDVYEIKAFQREQLKNNNLNFEFLNNSAITLQKFFRFIFARKLYYQLNKAKITNLINRNVILIQSIYRRFIVIKNLKQFAILTKILKTRKDSINQIIDLLFKLKNKISFNKSILYVTIINTRYLNTIKLQTNIRKYLIYSKIRRIIEKLETNYYITYPFLARTVLIKIYKINEKNKEIILTYQLSYSNLIKSFIGFIPYQDLSRGKYRTVFIIDNSIICDGRFPHIEFSDGQYYNIVDFVPRNNRNKIDHNTNTDVTKSNISISNYSLSISPDYNRMNIVKKEDLNIKQGIDKHKELKIELTASPALSYFEFLNESIKNEEVNRLGNI